MEKIRVAIAGVGNCASSLIQGVTYYRDANPADDVPGLMHVMLGDYHVSDIEFVAAFDGLAEVAADLGGVDVKGRDELDVADVIVPKHDVHEAWNVVGGIGVLVVGDALDE